MTPTQYQFLTSQLASLKTSVEAIDAKLDAALLQQARHDEQIQLLRKTSGGMVGVLVMLGGAWLKMKLGI